MVRRTLTPEEKRRKEMIKELLKETPFKNDQDLNNIMKNSSWRSLMAA